MAIHELKDILHKIRVKLYPTDTPSDGHGEVTGTKIS